MDEYIKREDAIKAIIEHPSKIGVFTAKAIRAIEDLPTADVAEVVRCKDCEYLTKEMIGDSLEFICKSTEGMVNPSPDFYCSYGKRKEDK